MASPLAQALSYQPPTLTNPQMQPTDVSGIYRDAFNEQMQKYQADIARSNAMWGGLAGLGGAGILAFGPKAASSIGSMFSGGGAGAAGGAGATAAAGAPMDLAAAGGAGVDEALLPMLLALA